jgi:L-alanine-DL-glutamate epimerase-like enolase superfamily enzyme
MKAIREAVGPDISLAMDGVMRMSLSEAIRLCRLCEDLDIAFIEEPVYHNDPDLLAELRRQTIVPVAAPPSPRASARTLLVSKSVDILQPNVMHHEGVTGALGVAELADAFAIPIGQGNGSGPHNIAFQAGVRNGSIIEYHYHRWKAYEAVYREVPPPVDGYLAASQEPGLGLEPKEGLLEQYVVSP